MIRKSGDRFSEKTMLEGLEKIGFKFEDEPAA
jgi:hypothetical protein